MSDTMMSMDYLLVDTLNADQLEVDDLIGLGDEIVKIIAITPMRFGYTLTYENEFGEKDLTKFFYTDEIKLFILQ